MTLAEKKCIPCSEGTVAFNRETCEQHLAQIKDWQISNNSKWIFKEFEFNNFLSALEFVNKVGAIAEEVQHHPNIDFTWGYCKISIQTHKINGLCENDFILAAKIDGIS